MEGAHEEQARTCPCCGEPLPLGLFERSARPAAPAVLEPLVRFGGMPDVATDTMVMAHGRMFIAVDASLPLDCPDSPVRVGAWVELSAEAAVIAVSRRPDQAVVVTGTMATDLPGFPGTLGAACTLSLAAHSVQPTLLWCADRRTQQLSGPQPHDVYADLYRRTWGNYGAVHMVSAELRAQAAASWRKQLDRPAFRKAFAPPPPLAGIAPGELLIAPPLDTGGEVSLQTIGMAEAMPTPVELRCRALDAPEEFIGSFAEFLYLPRIRPVDLHHGHVLAEPNGIPGTEGMTGWLIIDRDDEGEHAIALTDGTSVRLLDVVPLHEAEMAFAREFGLGALLERLDLDDALLADLRRAPVVGV